MTRKNTHRAIVTLAVALALIIASIPSPLFAGACTLPFADIVPLYAIKAPTAADVRLSWPGHGGDDSNSWQTTIKQEIPNLGMYAAPPTVRPVATCNPATDLFCIDPIAMPLPPSNITYYQVIPSCCGSEGLDPEIATMVSQVDDLNQADTIQTLVAFTTRNSCSDDTNIGAARDWIRDQFALIPNVQVVLHSYSQTGCAAPLMQDNVVAWLPGSGNPDRLIVIGGHYDNRTFGVSDPTSRAEGANDSGSQTALLLEAARVMAPYSFDATVVFVAFAGEEQGLVGSDWFVFDATTLLFPGATIELNLNCDVVGGDNETNDAAALQQFRLFSPGTPREVRGPDGTTDDTSPSRGAMRYVGYWGAGYMPSMAMLPRLREDRMGRGGDHQSFIRSSIPGIRFIEVNENLAHQHNTQDLFQFVTPSYTQRMTQVVVSVAASLARAATAPEGMTATMTGSDVSLSWTPPALGPAVDHYVLAARTVDENLYRARVCVPGDVTSAVVDPVAELDIPPGMAFYISIAAVDAFGHESRFAYSEYRCDAGGCEVPVGSLDVLASN